MINPFKEINWKPGESELRKFAWSLIIGFPCLALVFFIAKWAKAGALPQAAFFSKLRYHRGLGRLGLPAAQAIGASALCRLVCTGLLHRHRDGEPAVCFAVLWLVHAYWTFYALDGT